MAALVPRSRQWRSQVRQSTVVGQLRVLSAGQLNCAGRVVFFEPTQCVSRRTERSCGKDQRSGIRHQTRATRNARIIYFAVTLGSKRSFELNRAP